MSRLPIAALALFASLSPLGGCYRYDACARNLTGHDVRISIHKGTRQREVSTAVLGPGASVGWTGSCNGPVLLRVAAGGLSVDVPLPRRDHTGVQIAGDDGSWSIIKTIGEESYSIDPWSISMTEACGENCDKACCTEPAEKPAAPADGDGMLDLVEPSGD